jgi:cell division septation protein DedD
MGKAMDSAMRDLDQLRERDDDARGRKLGLLTLASIVSVAALIAGASLMGTGDAAEAATIDPLTELSLSTAQGHVRASAPVTPKLEARSLTFPSTLVDANRGGPTNAATGPDDPDHDDALVEATVRAAEAEHAALSAEGAPILPPIAAKTSADLPAANGATADHARLTQLAKRDPLVRSALPKQASVDRAPEGSEGAFTLQVVSYETRDAAENFARTLRSRGHKAFVAEAEVEGRGRYFRVRVGPFTTRKEAATYQGRFEDDEHMHTIVVSNAAK